MRIVFLGSGAFGLPTISRLAEAHELALVVTQPDRPAGRKRVLTPTPIGQWAAARDRPLIKPADVNQPEHLARIDAARPDAVVVIAFGQYLKQALVDQAGPYGAMNLHASLLPRHRGAAPINWTLIAGDEQVGNTVIRIAERMDAGPMLGWEAMPVDPMETAGELHDRLAVMGPDLVLDVLSRCEAGTATETPQDDAAATLAPKLSKADGVVDWSGEGRTIRGRVHGLTPWPGVKVAYHAPEGDGEGTLLLRRVREESDIAAERAPGTLIDSAEGLVATGDGAVRLLEVQPPGKRIMDWGDFQQGHGLPAGVRFR